jgi:CheY-like chemotaxis protein
MTKPFSFWRPDLTTPFPIEFMPAKILIVDDEPHMLRLTEFSLRKGGFEIFLGQNGREAVELARSQQPDLIVMDLQMPEVDGLAALQQLKSDPLTSAIPVIMLTVRGQAFSREQAGQLGAALYLTKPFSPAQLLSEAQRLLASTDSSTRTGEEGQ